MRYGHEMYHKEGMVFKTKEDEKILLIGDWPKPIGFKDAPAKIRDFFREIGLNGHLSVIDAMVFPTGVTLEIDCRSHWPQAKLVKANGSSAEISLSVITKLDFRKAFTAALEEFAGQRPAVPDNDKEKNKKDTETWVVVDGRKVPAKYLADGI
ncbi:MAG: hypothetical protein V1867_00540 [Candidatus Falkowbacteria bacterium]